MRRIAAVRDEQMEKAESERSLLNPVVFFNALIIKRVTHALDIAARFGYGQLSASLASLINILCET